MASLENDTQNRIDLRDTKQKGLQLRISPSGLKVFRMEIWDTNTKKRIKEKIGVYPEISINEAREIVAKRIADIANGIDVIERKNKMRSEFTLDEAFEGWHEHYSKGSGKAPSSIREDLAKYNLHIRDRIGKYCLSEISDKVYIKWRNDILAMKKQRGEGTISKGTVNSACQIISSIFNKYGKDLPNLCEQVPKFKVAPRKRFLKPAEIKKFYKALDARQTPGAFKKYRHSRIIHRHETCKRHINDLGRN